MLTDGNGAQLLGTDRAAVAPCPWCGAVGEKYDGEGRVLYHSPRGCCSHMAAIELRWRVSSLEALSREAQTQSGPVTPELQTASEEFREAFSVFCNMTPANNREEVVREAMSQTEATRHEIESLVRRVV